jgi:ATP-dependent DNA helicase RecQ
VTRQGAPSGSPIETLREVFGHDDFRAGQEQVVRALLDGRPSLAVFPTGGGKSICYQLPAVMLDGLTLVVSPLIALMKDQVDSLNSRGIAAARLDSTLDTHELGNLYRKLDHGEIKLLYIAPERLANEAFRKRVQGWNIALLAVDEAHCISEWGHNFRPDYLKLAMFRRSLRIRRVLALTATATPNVAAEIRRHFTIAKHDFVRLSFHRPNLDLRVTPCTASERKRILLERLAAVSGPVVVYVTRQETAEEVASFLVREGVQARAYHAGLHDDFRSDAQRAFMAGETRVIVATIAFGMGIDKADIRGVIHYNLPKSLENHTQEIGRAGRDGMPAVCELLACADDLTVLENFIHSDTPSPRALGNLINRVLRLGTEFDISLHDLSVSCDIRTTVIATLLAYLENDGILESRGVFYSTYKIKLLRDRAHITAGMPPRERKLVDAVLDHGTTGRSWIAVEPSAIAAALGIRREKITTLITALEGAGDAALAISGVRHAYQLKKEPGDLNALAARHVEQFQQREKADLQRLSQVLGISSHRGCLTDYLTRHFGEKLDSPCGHCDRCRGLPATLIRRAAARRPDDHEWQLARELARGRHPELATPRQLARFLCGMSSPATTRARLTRHDAFGIWSDLPFEDVLAMAEAL